MKGGHLLTAGAVVAFTLLSYAVFPGRLYIHNDTQIYLPILERFYDSSLFAKDLIATQPHVSFTIYDEVALFARRVLNLGFRETLFAQQFIFRAAGILGILLIGQALGLSRRMALLGGAVFALGAWIYGPTILTVEFEPVPRGFAAPLLLLGVGLAAHGRDLAAGIAVGIAFLYHPPTVYPFWLVYFCLTLWPGKPEVMQRRILGLLPMFASVILLFAMSRLQIGESEKQDLFGRIDDFQANLQRMRASYNWISVWGPSLVWHHLTVWILGMLAFCRVRRYANQDLKFFLMGLPLIGMLSMPASYWLLEKMRFAVVPQFQPMRALLFVTVVFLICVCAAGITAARERRPWEAVAWFFAVFLIPLQFRAEQMLSLNWFDPSNRRRLLLALAFSGIAATAAWLEKNRPRWSALALAWAVLLPFFLLPAYGRLRPFRRADSPELAELSSWARTSTPKDAVFFFPRAGVDPSPGIFRVGALRAVYVDWKSGGQVNYLRKYSEEWWSRYEGTKVIQPKRATLPQYAQMGIDYLVIPAARRIAGLAALYENRRFVVYSTR